MEATEEIKEQAGTPEVVIDPNSVENPASGDTASHLRNSQVMSRDSGVEATNEVFSPKAGSAYIGYKPLMTSQSGVNQTTMLLTGFSHFTPSNKMIQAKQQLRIMEHQKTSIQNRIIKLAKEDEQVQKRIKDAHRKTEFL